jgi:hypothetical protein
VGHSNSQRNLKAVRLGSIVAQWLSEGTADCEMTALRDSALMTHVVNLPVLYCFYFSDSISIQISCVREGFEDRR